MSKKLTCSEARQTIVDNLNKAVDSGKFMVAIWRVENGRLELDRTSYEFPVDDLLRASAMISSNALQEVDRIVDENKRPSTPLETADIKLHSEP